MPRLRLRSGAYVKNVVAAVKRDVTEASTRVRCTAKTAVDTSRSIEHTNAKQALTE
jgi:hypothetical protein